MRVVTIPLFRDNYAYALVDAARACLVDPALEEALRHSDIKDCSIESILVTHHHDDHAREVASIAQRTKASVFATDDRIPLRSASSTPLKFANMLITPILTPAHTTGSTCFLVTESDSTEQVLFTGDTLFVAGCGRFFEGTAKDMESSLRKLAALHGETKIYCGHEYTVSNLEFAASVDPDNQKIKQKLSWARAIMAKASSTSKHVSLNSQDEMVGCTVPSTIADELLTNPFMRVWNPEFQAVMGIADPVELMGVLRELKNNF